MEPLSIVGLLGLVGAGGAAVRYVWDLSGSVARRERLERARIDAQTQVEVERARAASAVACASVAGAPRSIHYAPHITHAAPTSAHTNAHTASGDTVSPPSLPGVVDLAAVDLLPGRVLLGLGVGGQAITTTPAALMHIGCIGATGSGKTNAARVLLAQLLALGGSDVYIANPHHVSNDIDNPTGGDWRAIEAALAAPAAYHERDIGDMLDKLAASVDERWAVKRSGRRVGKAQVLYIDELPAILDQVRGALGAMSTILRRGRAVGVYLLSLSQDMATKTLGKDAPGAIRENFRTAVYSGGDSHSAALLLDMSRKDLAGYESELGQGVALVKAHQQAATLARVPFASNDAVRALLCDTSDNDLMEISPHDTETPEVAYTSSERVGNDGKDIDYTGIITRLRAQGLGKRKIIETIWNVKPGGSPAYKEASAIYDTVASEVGNV